MILNIFKPKGWSSRDVVNVVSGILKIKKVGHAGTLDPLAEGVLVVLTGKDTKKQSEVMTMSKRYYFEAVFGVETPTNDLEILPVYKSKPNIRVIKEKLPVLMDKYSGEFEQVVPIYSAKKVNGVRLYKQARKLEYSEQVDLVAGLPKNKITIYEYSISGYDYFDLDTQLGLKRLPCAKIEVRSSHGMYVRSLVRDLGNDLGFGAVASKIVRTAVGDFTIENTLRIEDLKDIGNKSGLKS